MLPILLGAGAAFAALFLSGCNNNKKPTESQGNPAGDAGASAPDAAQAVPPPLPSSAYFTSFGNDLRAADIYQRLSEKEVPNEALDRGCHSPAIFGHPSFQRAKDRRIEACEVYDFALENYQKFPEIVETLTGGPVPWSLDDRDPATSQDAKIRERVQEVIARLQESPGLKKFGMKSDDYRQRLAAALALFVDFPSDPQVLKSRHDELRKQSEELLGLELQDFQEELLEKGGMGASKFAEDEGEARVRTALQALALRRGGSLARAKVLYAVLAQAELSPRFILSTEKSNSDLFEEGTKAFLLNFGGKKSHYLRVGVPLSQRTIPLKGLRENAAADSTIQELGLTTFLAMDFHEEGDFRLIHSKSDPSLAYKMALNLSPTDTAIFNSIGVTLETMGNLNQAETALKESLRFDPTNGSASYNLGRLYERQEKFEMAVKAFLSVAVFSPSIFEIRMETIDPVVQRVLARDPKNEEAKGLASKIKEIREERASGKPDAQ